MMAKLIRTSQPIGATSINKSNPISRTIASTLLYSGDYPPYDLAIGKRWIDSYWSSDRSFIVAGNSTGQAFRSRFGGYRFTTTSGVSWSASDGATSLLVVTVRISGDGTLAVIDNGGWFVAKIKLAAGFFAASEWTGSELVATSPSAYVLGRKYVVVARSTLTAVSLWIDGVKVAESAGVFGNASLLRATTYNNNGNDGGTDINLGLSFNSALSDSQIVSISANPWQVFAPPRKTVSYSIVSGGGSVNYELTATSSAYAISSKTASLSFNRKLAATSQAYSITSNTATFKRGYSLIGAVSAFAISSKTATFAFNRKLSLAPSAYAISAKTATLTYTNGAVTQNYTLSATSSAYAISSKTAGLSFNRKLAVTSQAYAIASKTAALTYTAGNATQNYILSAAVREYVITSGSATLNFSSITNYTNAPSGVTYHRDFVNSKRESSSNSARPAFKNTTRH